MDALGEILEPYSDDIGKFAGGVTCLQFLSGVFLMNDIRKKGSSDAYPPEPFLGGIVLSVLSLKLASIMGDDAMIKTNIIGFGISVVFVALFYYYASKEFRTKIWSKLGIAGVFILACLAYANFEDPAQIEFRFGMLITAMLVALVGMPLLSVGKIIENKSTEGLPFPLILSGTIVAASWALYGISIKNSVVTYQNLFLLTLSSIQLSFFAIYPNTPTSPSKLKKPSSSASSIDKKKN